MDVASFAGDRIQFPVSAHTQPLIEPVLAELFQVGELLVVAGRLIDAPGRQPSQRAQNHNDNQPELDVFVHGNPSPALLLFVNTSIAPVYNLGAPPLWHSRHPTRVSAAATVYIWPRMLQVVKLAP